MPVPLRFTGDPARALPLPCGTPQTMHLCGRPLGMAFSGPDDLIIADAYLGLLKMNVKTREITTLATKTSDGQPFKLLNSVVVARSGRIYMTHSTYRFDVTKFFYEVLEARPSGALYEYDPKTKQVNTIATVRYSIINMGL